MARIEAWWGNTTWSSDLKFSADAKGPALHEEGGACEPSKLGPLSFPSLVFLAREGQESLKDSRPYSPYPPGFLAVVPQWGLILDVPT